MKASRRWRQGFTLVEMLLVIVLIGIVTGMIVTRVGGKTEQARIARAQSDIRGQLSTALDMFEQDIGRYPTAAEGLKALVENTGIAGWKGPYLKGELRNDPWDSPYSYSLDSTDGTRYVLLSAGPDRQLGTNDDIKE